MNELPVTALPPEEAAKQCGITTDTIFSFGAEGVVQFVFFSKGFKVEHYEFLEQNPDGSPLRIETDYTYETGFVPLHQDDVAAIWACGQAEITRLAPQDEHTHRRIIRESRQPGFAGESRSVHVDMAELRIFKEEAIRFQKEIPLYPRWMTVDQVSERWGFRVGQLLDLAIEGNLTLLFHCPYWRVEFEMIEECDSPPYWFSVGWTEYKSGFLPLHIHSIADLRHAGKADVTIIADSPDGFSRRFIESFYDAPVGFKIETSGVRVLFTDVERFELEHNFVPVERIKPSSQRSVPTEKAPSPFLFSQEGENWRIRFKGAACGTFKNSKGLHIIAYMLQNPGRDFHVSELRRIADPPPPVEAFIELEGITQEQMGNMGLSLDGGELDAIPDERAIRDIRAKLEKLQGQIEDAKEFGNTEKKALLEEEQYKLLGYLNPSLGKQGRPRKATDQVEKDRKAVSMAIGRARKLITTACPDLGNHLNSAIQTGTTCAYLPDREIFWSF